MNVFHSDFSERYRGALTSEDRDGHGSLFQVPVIKSRWTECGGQRARALRSHGGSDGGGGTCEGCCPHPSSALPPLPPPPPRLFCTSLPHPENSCASLPRCSAALLALCAGRASATVGSAALVAPELPHRLEWLRPSCSGCCDSCGCYRAHSPAESHSGDHGCIWRKSGGASGTCQSPRPGRRRPGHRRALDVGHTARSEEVPHQDGGARGRSPL